jgi:hypothetical protein
VCEAISLAEEDLMQTASSEAAKPGFLSQGFLSVLIDSLAFGLYFAAAYLVVSQFYKIHWILGLIYLIPFLWGYSLFFISPLAEDGQTAGQRMTGLLTYRKDGKEYKKGGSTGGIGVFRSALVWVVSRGIFPALGAIVLYTNFSIANLVVVVVIYLLSVLLFAAVEDSLFGLHKVRFVRGVSVQTQVRGFFEKRKLGRPQLPSHAVLIPYLMLVGGLCVAVYSAVNYKANPKAAITGIVVGVISMGLGQTLTNVREWARWAAVIFLIVATVATFLFNFSSLQATVTAVLALLFAIDLLVDRTVANAFRSA